MIEGYMKSGNKERSIRLFDMMSNKNDYSWNVVFSGFAKAGEMEIARRLFNEMPNRNGVVWNSMIHSYARNGSPREAVRLFKELNLDPLDKSCCDTFVLATVIGACTDLGEIQCGKQIHARILIDNMELDSVLTSSLINLYGKCGDLDSAHCVLNTMEEPDDFSLSALITGYANHGRMNDARRAFYRKSNSCVVVWNSLISGYVTNNEEIEAFLLFNDMQKKGLKVDFSTLATILSACSSLCNSQHGKQMHAYACKVGLICDNVVASAFIDAYSKCGSLNDACKLFSELKTYDTILLNSMITVYSNSGKIEDAKQIFNTMPSKSLISWNSMIVGLSQNGCPVEALDLFCMMNKLDLRMNRFNLTSVISACASISSLELGEQIFARATVVGLDSDEVISTSLVDFYCKCGFIEIGRKLFDTMMKSDEISWNSMLMGYATNGHGLEALTLFNEMRHAGVRPTEITFTGVLSACDHCGLVEEGWRWFNIMQYDYHIDPGIEHYSCMVDLFARAGCLEEAMNLIKRMPFEADASMWSSVLRGCMAHGEKDLGEKVAQQIIELDPGNSGAYVQLSSIFATSGDWESSALVRKVMQERQVQKYPGYSWANC
jgi:pentatricopeptide repeat protein